MRQCAFLSLKRISPLLLPYTNHSVYYIIRRACWIGYDTAPILWDYTVDVSCVSYSYRFIILPSMNR